jgi:hypothetical protein
MLFKQFFWIFVCSNLSIFSALPLTLAIDVIDHVMNTKDVFILVVIL